MSGDMAVRAPEHAAGSHLRVRFTLRDGRHLDFDDPRKFGRIYYVTDIQEVVHRLGPEPLDDAFTAADFAARIRRRKTTVKVALLDQSIVAGLGNIYAVESLWRAKIHPLRRSDSLTDEETIRLLRAIREILGRAVQAQGTDIGDGVWKKGRFAPSIYGREGMACRRCRSEIERMVIAQRSTDFCPQCQPKRIARARSVRR
jgi:formamidopyrimidine-DNA glycosylase